MALATVTEGHMDLNGLGYFRANSLEIDLCDYGPKRTPLFAFNFMEVFKSLPFGKCKIEKTENIKVNFETTRASDFALNANFQVVGATGKLSAKNVYDLTRSGELVLTLLSIDVFDIITAANRSPLDLRELNRLGVEARIVNQVVIAVSAKLSEALTSSTDVSVSAEKGEIKLSVVGRGSASQRIDTEIPPGATFAYMLLNPEWDAVLPKRREKLVGGRFDQHSRIDP